MPLTSKITDYNNLWPEQFEEEAARLKPVFKDDFLSIHHVGSTAVVGLAAKPEIDVLVIVSSGAALSDWESKLQMLGYRRGGDLSKGHHFFKRDVDGVRTHKLHVCENGHPRADRMLKLRDHLRNNVADRDAYAALKVDLEAANQTGIAEYLEGKSPFLDELYKRAGLGD